jgi:MYXO-CTERM domain-containing protein
MDGVGLLSSKSRRECPLTGAKRLVGVTFRQWVEVQRESPELSATPPKPWRCARISNLTMGFVFQLEYRVSSIMLVLGHGAHGLGPMLLLAFAASAGCYDPNALGEGQWSARSRPLEWTKPSGPLELKEPAPYDMFGFAVALSGAAALVGSPGASATIGDSFVPAAGAASLLVLKNGKWGVHRELISSSPLDYAQLGFSVAISSDVAVMGAPSADPNEGAGPIDTVGAGLVHAVHKDGAGWDGPLETIVDPYQGAQRAFGRAVAASDGRILVGVPNDFTAPGEAIVFDWDGSNWQSQPPLRPPVEVAEGDCFGEALALEEGLAIVGALCDGERGESAGAAYVFERSGGTWVRQQKLLGSDTAAGDGFGGVVDIRGSRALIGAIGNLGWLGAVYVFEKDSGTGNWGEVEKLVDANATTSDGFGDAAALGREVAWVGVSNRSGTGAVLPFELEQGDWSAQPPIVLTEDFVQAAVGYSLAASGGGVLIGAPYWADVNGAVFFSGLATGQACEEASDCSSGYCVEGVCCNSACDNLCSSCLAARKASGADGACGWVRSQTNPRTANCEATLAMSCGTTGLCDGAGSCAFHRKGTECGAPSCADESTEDPKDSCDGKGVCVQTPPTSCGALTCSGVACLQTCSQAGDCKAGTHCDPDGTCRPDRGLGAKCTLAAQCESGFCADGVCCSTACDGQCEACAEGKSLGSCTAVAGVPRGARPACEANAEHPCLTTSCDGIEARSCAAYASEETTCRHANCEDGTAVPEGRCDGQGECSPGSNSACGLFACGDDACLTACQSDLDCVGGSYCDGERCMAGTRCSADNSKAINEVGDEKDCFPYKCGAQGVCLEECSELAQCAEGELFCDRETRTCEPVTPEVMVSTARRATSSCICSPAPPGATGAVWLAALILIWRARRRARSEPTCEKDASI